MSRTAAPATIGSDDARSVAAGGFRVTEFVLPPLLALPPHHHDTTCLSVLLGGSVDEVVGRRALAFAHASVFVKPAGERHSDRIGRAGARALAIEAEPGTDRAALLDLPADPLARVLHFRDARSAALAAAIVRELRAPDALSPLAVEGITLELVAAAARRGAPPRPPERRAPAWLERVRELLHDRFAAPLRLADVAAAAGVHPAHLSRVFRAHHGSSLGGYVRHLRLEWAAERLTRSSDSLTAVALAAGFADQSHFTRAFKRHTGMTPEQYRMQVRNTKYEIRKLPRDA